MDINPTLSFNEKQPIKTEPVCPYCQADPLDLQAAQANVGLVPIYVYYCGNLACRKVFNVVSMPPMPKLPGGRVVMPPAMTPRRIV